MTKSRIGILGGTFDPIHLGHLGLATEALSKLELRQIFLVPSFVSPHKTSQTITPIEIRVQMATLAVKPYSGIEVSTLEAERGGISYTIDTVTHFSKKFANDEVFFLAGMDSFIDIGEWKDFQRILELSNVAIAVRPGIKMPDIADCFQNWFGCENPYIRVESDKFLEKFVRIDKNKQIVFFQPKPCPAASNEIRSMVAEGKGVKNLLPAKVENYIIGHHLYRVTPPA